MNKEQIRARQLINDLETQAKELKEEISYEMNAAITRALEQSYTLGQDDLRDEAIEKLRRLPGAQTSEFGQQIQQNKRVELAQVLKIFDIVVTKTGTQTKLKTTER